MAGPRFDRHGSIQVEKLENWPETIMPHICQRATAEFIPAAEYGMRVVGMIGPVQRGSEPQLPVEAFRDGRRLRRNCRVLRPHGPVRPVMDFAQLADGAIIDPCLYGVDIGAVAG